MYVCMYVCIHTYIYICMLYMCIYVPLDWTSTSLVFHSHLASFFLFVHSCLLYLDTCIKSHS